MAASKDLSNVASELAALKHEKKNQRMKKLPSNATIQRRPLSHGPIASPYAGANVQKVVYVSRKTPVMSAVKRVQKLLQHVEKRAMQSIELKGQTHAKAMTEIAEDSRKLSKTSEEVLVKASGRAMEQALRIAQWFRSHEDEMLCDVQVRTGSVAAVDDIIEGENLLEENQAQTFTETQHQGSDQEAREDGDTTMELLEDPNKSTIQEAILDDTEAGSANVRKPNSIHRKRRKRQRPLYDEDDLPEARIRWVKTVEIAISLKGCTLAPRGS